MSKRYRSRTLSPTELSWEERNQPNYLFQPSKAFERMEKIDIKWFNASSNTCRRQAEKRRRK
jgi:hypothetical protein